VEEAKGNCPRGESDPGRVLAVDLGTRRIGLAVSDPLGLTAQGLPSLRRDRDPVALVLEVCREKEVAAVVVGLPLNLDGSRGPAAEEAEKFAAELERRGGLPVMTLDERLSSVTAERTLVEAGVSRAKRRTRGLVDRGAATVILQAYLARR
jgi:putative Holliday junction resolvase